MPVTTMLLDNLGSEMSLPEWQTVNRHSISTSFATISYSSSVKSGCDHQFGTAVYPTKVHRKLHATNFGVLDVVTWPFRKVGELFDSIFQRRCIDDVCKERMRLTQEEFDSQFDVTGASRV